MTTLPAIGAANPWLSHTVRLARIVGENAEVATYDFEFVDAGQAEHYRFLPGQFNMIYLPGFGESAISVSAAPDSRQRWAHTIRTAGNVTRELARLAPGATLGLRGPFGSCWPIANCPGQDLLLVAGGIGLAPLRPVIYHVAAHRPQFGRVTVLCGARTPDGLLYTREHAAWQAAGIETQTTVDRSSPGWTGNVGVVTLLVDRLPLPRPAQTAVFMCGPEVMMEYAARSALRRGIPTERIWISSERNMQCAVGLCGHCQLGPAFLCKDGPVFRYDRLAPFLRVEHL